jgi:hypothetical protein
MRFRSRSGVLLLRDLVGGVGDQLAGIKVTGPIWDPKASLIPLPALAADDPALEGAGPLRDASAAAQDQ